MISRMYRIKEKYPVYPAYPVLFICTNPSGVKKNVFVSCALFFL
jgi:hypothetical protein